MLVRRLPIQPSGYPTMPTRPGEYCGPIDAQIYDRPGSKYVRTVFYVNKAGYGAFVHSPPHIFHELESGHLDIWPGIE
jgi:hypothetical protein